MPGGRRLMLSSVSHTHDLMYLFGGEVHASSGTGKTNDLWGTKGPTVLIGASPTAIPTASPTASPSTSPTASPSASPTPSPSTSPTASPSTSPTASPTTSPTASPTTSPTSSPTVSPTMSPSPSPAPRLLALFPPYGPTIGGTFLRITGSELNLMGTNITVTFDVQTVPGTRIGLAEIQCITPSFPAATNVTVTVQGSWSTLRVVQQFTYYGNLSLSRVHPMLALRTGGQPIVLEGINLPNTGNYFTVRLMDSNGNNATTPATAVQNGNRTTFIAPSFADFYDGSTPTYDVTLDIAPNGQDYVIGSLQSLRFKFYVLPTLSSSKPSQIQTNTKVNITLQGTGFFDSGVGAIKCRLGADIVTDGVYLSPTSVKCIAPAISSARIVNLEVSMDGVVFTTGGAVRITVVEYVSNECREKGELRAFQSDREQLGLRYFPNLAVGAAVTTSSRRDSYRSDVGRALSPSQLVDGDRCCEYSLETDGYKCGTIFDTESSASELASVLIDLGSSAYVDEVLTTWFRPCKNLPDPGYTLKTRAGTSGEWTDRYTRAVWKENPCRTFTGDDGPTAFCADFFDPIVAQQFRVTFNNSVNSFLVGAGTDGGWLMEFEVHGIFLKTPYQVATDSPPLFAKSGIVAPVPPMVVELLSILGGAVNGSDPEVSRNVSLQLLDSAERDVTSEFLVAHVATPVQGAHNFSTVALSRPKVGLYSLVFSSHGLRSCNATLTVFQGDAAYLGATSVVKVYPSASSVSLETITVMAYDEGANWVSGDSLMRNVTVSFVDSTLAASGQLSALMSGGKAEFSGIKVSRPTLGIHSLLFSTEGVRSVVYNVSVGIGDAYQLSLDACTIDPKPSEATVNIPTLNVRIRDAGGVWITTATDEVKATLVGAGSTLVGNGTVTAESGIAVFSGLQLSSPRCGTYSLQFSSSTLPNSPPLSAAITIVHGPATSIFIDNLGSVNTSYDSALSTRIDPIGIGALDAGGNRVYIDRTVLSSLAPIPSLLSGSTIAEMSNGTALISNLTLLSPPSGNYSLSFSVAGLTGAHIPITVVPGLAASLKITGGANQTHESAAEITIGAIYLVALDAGGSVASSGRKAGDAADPTVSVSCSAATLSGTFSSKMSSSGSASLTDIKMQAPKSGVYTLQFTSSNDLVASAATVHIQVGPPYRLVVESPDSSKCNPACEPPPPPGQRLCCRSFFNTSIPSITVKAVDAGGDFATAHGSITVQAMFAANSSAKWTGPMTASLSSGNAVFAGLILQKPVVGVYVIDFAASSLVGVQLALEIEVGKPAGLKLVSVPPSAPYPCVAETKLDDVRVQLLDAGGTAISSLDDSLSLELRADRVDDGTSVIGAVNSNVDIGTGVTTWTNLITKAPPKIGDLRVTVTGMLSNTERYVNFTSSVTNGPATSFAVSDAPTSALNGAAKVSIPPMTLFERDAGGNRAASTPLNHTISVTLSKNPSMLGGPVQFQMHQGLCAISGIWLNSPSKDTTYNLDLNATSGLPTITLPIKIKAGPPAMLAFDGEVPAESDNTQFIQPAGVTSITVVLKDGAGNRVELTTARTVKVEVVNGTTAVSLRGALTKSMAPPASSVLFDDLVLEGTRGATYYLQFSVEGGGDSLRKLLPITIQPCDSASKLPGSVTDPSNEKECACPKGATLVHGKCVACNPGFYKDSVSNVACTLCTNYRAHTTSASGTTSTSGCWCKPGLFYNVSSTGGDCVACNLEVAVCNGGDPTDMGSIYPKEGYWRASSGVHPWEIIQCPLGDGTMCKSTLNSANACANHYHGPMCSLCDDGYAVQSGVCLLCSSPSVNWVVLAAMAVVVFCIGRYYVNKQMLGGRSPEATILKVIISYVQMLGFIGGFRARWLELMKMFFIIMGSTANLDLFEIQPIDCAVRSNYYTSFFLFLSVIPLCFVVPAVFYHIGRLPVINSLFNRKKPWMLTRESAHQKSSSVLRTVLWPVVWLMFGLVPAVPLAMRRAWHSFARSILPQMNQVKNKICGEHLRQDNPVSIHESASFRSTAIDDSMTEQVRLSTKSSSVVLFEEDPFLGRSAMSASKSAFWILLFFFLPTVMKNTMGLFNCVKIGPKYLVDTDLSIECYDTLHNSVFIYAFCVVLVPIVAVLISYVVYKNAVIRKRRELVRYLSVYNLCSETATGALILPPGIDEGTASILRNEKQLLRRLRKYMFLFSGYRSEGVLFLWDLVIMARKIAIAAILVFARQHVVLQIFCSLIVFVIALVLHLVFRPFDDEYAKQKKMPVLPSTLEFVSILATIFTLLCGFLFYLKDSSILNSDALAALDITLLLFNGLVLLTFIYLLFRSVLHGMTKSMRGGAASVIDSMASQNAAKWWREKCGCCSWGVREKEGGADVQMEEMGVRIEGRIDRRIRRPETRL